jgi:hypothetical protein
VFISKRGTNAMDHVWLNDQMRKTALKLAKQGLVENGDPSSWHSHMLRHSFKSEGEHSGVNSKLAEFMMGHNSGISWVYDNRDTTHEQDFIEAYETMESYLSLDFNEAVAREEKEETGREMLKLIMDLQRQVAEMKTRQASSGAPGPPRF